MDGEASHGLQSFARSGTQSSMAAADRRVPVVFERKTLRDFIWDDGIGKMTKSQTQREVDSRLLLSFRLTERYPLPPPLLTPQSDGVC